MPRRASPKAPGRTPDLTLSCRASAQICSGIIQQSTWIYFGSAPPQREVFMEIIICIQRVDGFTHLERYSYELTESTKGGVCQVQSNSRTGVGPCHLNFNRITSNSKCRALFNGIRSIISPQYKSVFCKSINDDYG